MFRTIHIVEKKTKKMRVFLKKGTTNIFKQYNKFKKQQN